MDEAKAAYEAVTGTKLDSQTALAVELVWAVEKAGNLLDRVKLAKAALELARAEGRAEQRNEQQ